LFRKILIAVAALLLLFLVYVASRPSTYAVERSVAVSAPPAVVFSQVVDFGRWEAWSPWSKLDPNQKTTMTGTPGAVGSRWEWSGNKDVGKGRMTITEARPGERIGIDLEFVEPFASRADTSFALAPEGSGTQVTWTMAGKLGFVEKAMGVFMSMDAMIGKDFEKGLAQLKAVSEAEAARLAAEAKAAADAAVAAPAGVTK
jgi:carbon monoxide dehydrogenase subunit G